jgi:hypothetical protein
MWVILIQGRINGRISLINLSGIPSRPVAMDLARDKAFKTNINVPKAENSGCGIRSRGKREKSVEFADTVKLAKSSER